MKSFKILIAAAAMVTALASGCMKEPVVTGIDSSKACAKDLTYDPTNSSDKALAFWWNADDALKAGATSFSVQLYKAEDATDIDMYDSSVGQTVQANATTNDAVIFSGLTKGSKYYARVRANYPRSVYSDWCYYTVDGEKYQVKVGSGPIRPGEFESPYPLELLTALSKSLEVGWNTVDGSTGYVLEYKLSSASSWTALPATAAVKAEILDLTPDTQYDIRVKAVASGKESQYATLTASTAPESSLPTEMKTADEFITWLTDGAPIADPSVTYSLVNDLDFTGKNVIPAESFPGVLDGKGHALKNLNLSSPLFAENKGTIRDLVIDASCKFDFTIPEAASIVLNNYGTVSGCTNNATIKFAAESLADPAVIGGIAAFNYGGKITGCTNNGDVTFDIAGTSVAFGVGGIAGYSDGEISSNTNNGGVSASAERCATKKAIGTISSATGCMGGILAYGGAGMTVTSCVNNGALYYNMFKIEGASANMNRNQVGGIVAAPFGDVVGCTNTGKIEAYAVSSADAVFSSNEYIVGVAGISGGDYFTTGNNVSNIIDCVNEGDIFVKFDASKSNSTVGGIVAWPGVEGAEQTVVTRNCINKGNVTVGGYGKGRFGGIQGGSGNLEGCKNYGTVTNNTNVSGSCVGGVCGYRNYNMFIRNCENYGDVVNTHAELVYTGGLIGAWGGQDFNSGEGCVVKCKIEVSGAEGSDLAKYTGFILGRFNGDKKDTLGSDESPIKVGGTLVVSSTETKLDASNFKSYCTGTERVTNLTGGDSSCKRQLKVSFAE